MGFQVLNLPSGIKSLPYEGLRTLLGVITSIKSVSGGIPLLARASRFPIHLKDTKHGYSCRQITAIPEELAKYERARELVAQAQIKYGYVGWSNEIDRTYDHHASFFIVEDHDGEIVATSRLVHRGESLVAPEKGFKKDGTHHSFADEAVPIVDINSFYFKKGHRDCLMLLFSAIARYGAMAGIKRAFCMLDKENQFIEKLYLAAGFRFSSKFSEPISFPTYHKKIDRNGGEDASNLQPACWTIMAMEKATILKLAFLSLKYQSA
jgi:hypothetical protein